MRRNTVVIVVLATVVLVLVATSMVLLLTRQPTSDEQPPPPSPESVEPTTQTATASPKHTPMAFAREGDAGKVVVAVERVARAGNAQVAVAPRNGGRWICILVNGRERYVELEPGLRADDFPWIREGGFKPPPPQLARSATSIYRSVAKRAMGYDPERGDRIVIVVCPKAQWPQLALTWPAD